MSNDSEPPHAASADGSDDGLFEGVESDTDRFIETLDPNVAAVEVPESAPLREIDLGWIIVNRLDQADWDAVRRVQQQTRQQLEELFPEFLWQMPVVRQEERVQERRVEPVRLLIQGSSERDSYRLDFALLITSADLITHYKPYAMGVVSRMVDIGVISTGRIDPQADDFSVARNDRIRIMSDRLSVLVLHILGHLCGLGHSEEPHNYMRDIHTIHELATLKEFTPAQVEQMRNHLVEVADERLEEQKGATRQPARFLAKSAWINRYEIFDAIREAKPWEFPKRLSRLTTAALSSMLILMITAETWDLALRQPVWRIVLLLGCTLTFTTGYIIARQRLLVRRHRRRLSEQSVVTNLSTVGIVLLGMMTTAAMLFTFTLGLGLLLFERPLVQEWTANSRGTIEFWRYGQFAAFVSSLGILVGALGASFEEQAHFRHITFVDEET